jgi:hypothetical protein
MFGFMRKKQPAPTAKQHTHSGSFRKKRFLTQGAPFYYTPGPVFTEPAMAAIYHTELQNPKQRILGGGYPVALQIRSLQPPQLFARPAVTIDGLGGQQAGQLAILPLADANGEWPDDSDVNSYTD